MIELIVILTFMLIALVFVMLWLLKNSMPTTWAYHEGYEAGKYWWEESDGETDAPANPYSPSNSNFDWDASPQYTDWEAGFSDGIARAEQLNMLEE